MGHIIGYIISSIIASVISGFLLIGIPFGILLEMKGLGDYMYALTIVLATVVELFWFLMTSIIGGGFDFSIKGIFNFIKSIFKKNKINEVKKDKKIFTTSDRIRYIIEYIILIAIAIYSVIFPQHSSIAKVIYNGTIIKILSSLFLPLIIINIINEIIEFWGLEKKISSIFSSIGIQLMSAVGAIVLGFIVSTGMLLVASVWYTDIEDSIRKSWFIYDNPNFDEIRKDESFNATDYLKSEYQKLVENYKATANCDYNEEKCMDNIKLEIVRAVDTRNADIRTYGYMYKSKIKVDANTDVLCITDMKTRHNLFYKINYNVFSFEEITMDEYNSYAESK